MLTGWNRTDESSVHFTPCLCYFTLQFPSILQQILMEVSTPCGIYVDDRLPQGVASPLHTKIVLFILIGSAL